MVPLPILLPPTSRADVTQAFLFLSSLPFESPLSGYASEQLRVLTQRGLMEGFGFWIQVGPGPPNG